VMADGFVPDAQPSSSERAMSSIGNAGDWLNTAPLSTSDLRGHVVLVDFWTYTCVNWLRTLPYLRAWDEKYRDQGLIIVGVHTPEFPFEKDPDNVRRAVRDMEISYPVVLDGDYTIWRAFDNQYWPALYFVDTFGEIRGSHFGEGAYDRSEQTIQQLLAETGATDVARDLVTVDARGAEAAADWDSLASGENYLGYDRTSGFASPDGAALDVRRRYVAPPTLPLNHWALSGEWTFQPGASVLDSPNGHISYRFHARDLNIVMGPAMRGTAVPFRVRIDGHPPRAAHGADVDEQGNGTVAEQRLYQLIRQPNPVADRQFDLEFLDPGVEAFVFTFG
jgi:thiol-disulfide isomerase/thioredoxin